jgi:hypothetical protein
MSIEDRIRRVLADAVADEPPLRGAPLEAATRRRRGRPVLAGVVAMVLVLAAVVALAAVRGQREQTRLGPTPTTTPAGATTGWKTFTDPPGNLQFRYPPDWALRRLPKEDDAVVLVPPEDAGRPIDQAEFRVRILLGEVFWVGEMWSGRTTTGRLPNGQAYLLDVKGPTATQGNRPAATGRTRSTGAATAPGTAVVTAAPTASSSASADPRPRPGTATARSPTRSPGPPPNCGQPGRRWGTEAAGPAVPTSGG